MEKAAIIPAKPVPAKSATMQAECIKLLAFLYPPFPTSWGSIPTPAGIRKDSTVFMTKEKAKNIQACRESVRNSSRKIPTSAARIKSHAAITGFFGRRSVMGLKRGWKITVGRRFAARVRALKEALWLN